MNRTVRMLIPYYGKWPSYLSFFLEGCAYNNWLEIHFFTDLKQPNEAPPNVFFHAMTFEDLVDRIRTITNVAAAIKQPYKLCDIKPMYGEIFLDFLTGADFWGYGDIDVIYGNLSRFLTRDVFEKNDIISFRKHWLSGCFVLFKNAPLVNALYRQSRSYESVLLSEEYQGFDECFGNHYQELMRGRDILDLDNRDSMSYLVKKAGKSGSLSVFFEDCIQETLEPGTHVIRDLKSILRCDGKEVALIHFVILKNKDRFSFPCWRQIPSKFYVTWTGFYKPYQFENKLIYYAVSFTRILKGIGRRLCRLPRRLRKICASLLFPTRNLEAFHTNDIRGNYERK